MASGHAGGGRVRLLEHVAEDPGGSPRMARITSSSVAASPARAATSCVPRSDAATVGMSARAGLLCQPTRRRRFTPPRTHSGQPPSGGRGSRSVTTATRGHELGSSGTVVPNDRRVCRREPAPRAGSSAGDSLPAWQELSRRRTSSRSNRNRARGPAPGLSAPSSSAWSETQLRSTAKKSATT